MDPAREAYFQATRGGYGFDSQRDAYESGWESGYSAAISDAVRTYAQTAYEAYCAESGGVSLVSGAQLPLWDELSAEIKAAWSAAAVAVRSGLD